MRAIPIIRPLSDLRVRQAEVLEVLSEEPVVLAQRGRPAAVLVSIEMWNEIVERLEDAEDALDAIQAQNDPQSAMSLEDYMDKTNHNIYAAFVGEAKAHFRLLAYAEKAEEEELPQVAALFRAVAEAERVHARRNLELLKEVVVKDTETNLVASFEREEAAAGTFYPRFIQEAEEEDNRRAAISFSQARDVDEQHASLYKRALDHLLADTSTSYHVCQVCGYVAEGEPPEECPICGVGREQFRKVR